MRAVFDTNIFVSELILPGSRAEEALAPVIEGADRLILSKPILDELIMRSLSQVSVRDGLHDLVNDLPNLFGLGT